MGARVGAAAPDAAARGGRAAKRADIQWLRALAVTLVVVYHVAPARLPGGYVGVDVFFVISGFLITGGLVSRPPRSWGAVAEFWSRRIRRLLPASFTVIAVTCLAMWLFGPLTRWRQTARDAVASVFYAQNWNMWRRADDYLQQGSPPSVFQHFWSLGVEEQFYVVWPVLIMATVWAAAKLARRAPSAVSAVPVVVGGVFAVSLGLSIWFTPSHPAGSYLVTPTRVWELALGGLLACGWPSVSRRLGHRPAARLVLVGSGLLAMGASAWLFSDLTPFPGFAALLPTAGAGLFIAGGRDPGAARQAPESAGGGGLLVRVCGWLERFWAFRPVRYVGDMSYSVYLWHWPVVLLAPYAVGRELGPVGKVVAVGFVLVLSAASYEWVEKPFQSGRWLRAGRWRPFVFAVCGMALVGVPGTALWVWLPHLAEQQLAAVSLEDLPCAGGQALLDPTCAGSDPHGQSLLITPLAAASDFRTPCFRASSSREPVICSFGLEPNNGVREVVLWGNSHAGQWLPALQRLAPGLRLNITTYLATGCVPTQPGSEADEMMRQASGCADASVDLEPILASRPDLVMLSNRSRSIIDSAADAVESSMWVLEQLVSAGVPVVVIKDNPVPDPPVFVPDCVDLYEDDLAACDGSRTAWESSDPWMEATKRLGSPLVSTLDLNDAMCNSGTCFAVVGGIIVFFDDNHLTATYVESLAPQIGTAIEHAVRRR